MIIILSSSRFLITFSTSSFAVAQVEIQAVQQDTQQPGDAKEDAERSEDSEDKEEEEGAERSEDSEDKEEEETIFCGRTRFPE
eukprot:g75.t1